MTLEEREAILIDVQDHRNVLANSSCAQMPRGSSPTPPQMKTSLRQQHDERFDVIGLEQSAKVQSLSSRVQSGFDDEARANSNEASEPSVAEEPVRASGSVCEVATNLGRRRITHRWH